MSKVRVRCEYIFIHHDRNHQNRKRKLERESIWFIILILSSGSRRQHDMDDVSTSRAVRSYKQRAQRRCHRRDQNCKIIELCSCKQCKRWDANDVRCWLDLLFFSSSHLPSLVILLMTIARTTSMATLIMSAARRIRSKREDFPSILWCSFNCEIVRIERYSLA